MSQTFLPAIRPLGRAATAEDVKAGTALFHLGGKGKPAELSLPATAVLKRDAKLKEPPRTLIVQAEVGPDGATTYGIIAPHEVRAAAAGELTAIKTFGEREKEERDAAEKVRNKKE